MATIPRIEVEGTHYDVGVAIGRRFGGEIAAAFERYAFLHERVLPYQQTAEGQAHYAEMLDVNRAHFPDYLSELEGVADGAGVPFEHLWLANLRGEYAAFLEQ